MRSMTTTTDELYLGATVRDVNDFFEQETTFLQEYYSHLKEAVAKADRMTAKHKGNISSFYNHIPYHILVPSDSQNPTGHKIQITPIACKMRRQKAKLATRYDSYILL